MRVFEKQIRCVKYICGLCLLFVLSMTPTAHAATCATNPNQQSCSGTYGVSETFFGTGGQYHSCSSGFSAEYCADETAGEMGVGNTKGGIYQAQAGFNTNRVPSLTFIVPTQSINVGVLTPGVTKVATATFSVESYLTSGYTVQVRGGAPANNGHQLAPMTAGGPSNSSAEQFGINLAANTCPATAPSVGQGSCSGTLGVGPSQAPDATFGFGTAASGYDTANSYKFNDGDVVAQSLKSSGTTNYTVSYIFNTTALTPGGTYTTNETFVATSTF